MELIAGRIESGEIKIGDRISISPCFTDIKMTAEVNSIEWQHRKVGHAKHGMDVGLSFKNQSPTFTKRQIKKGYIVTNLKNEIAPVKQIKAKIIVINHPKGIKEGYKPLLYCHQARTPCEIKQIISKTDLQKKNEIDENNKIIKKGEEGIVIIEPLKPFVAEVEEKIPKLGRFILRDANKTICAGEILEINS